MNKYTISVTGDDLLLTRQVERGLAEAIVVEVLSRGKRMTSTEVKTNTEKEEGGKGGEVVGVEEETSGEKEQDLSLSNQKISLKEFVRGFGVERTVDKILCIGVYLAKYEEMGLIERADVVAGLEQLAEPIPKNLSRDIGWAVKIGWLAKKEGVRGVYYVTGEGYEVVDGGFGAEYVEKTQIARVKK